MPADIPATMAAVLLTGHGGIEMLEYREDVPVPLPGPGEVLIRVGGAGVNNTDINTRTGWYSKAVTGDTESGGAAGFDQVDYVECREADCLAPVEVFDAARPARVFAAARLGRARLIDNVPVTHIGTSHPVSKLNDNQ